MAIRRKGYRRIVVDGVPYLWRTPRRVGRSDWEGDPGFVVIVQAEDRRGAALAIHFPQRHPEAAELFGTPVVSVVPSQVESAIRRGLAAGWRPAERVPFWFAVTGGPTIAEAATPRESWPWMAEYYRGFPERTCGFLAPLIAAVESLGGSEWGGQFWASPSHFSLVISLRGRWAGPPAGPRVVAVPEGETVSVRRYTSASEAAGVVDCPAAECLPVIEAGLVWLADRWPA